MAGDRRRQLTYVALIAVPLLLALVVAFFSARSLSAVSAPENLTADAATEGVKLTWSAVEDADTYTLVRDGEDVVYTGRERTFTDISADVGKHHYSVSAAEGTRISVPSGNVEVTVDVGWGDVAPFVAQFPDLLPPTPDQTGWEQSRCQWMIRPEQSELGSGPTGSGQVIGKARIACVSSSVDFQISWMVSKDAANTYFGQLSKNAAQAAISWRHGSGYVNEKTSEIYLRLQDHPDVFIGLTSDGASRAELLRLANSLPIE